MSASSVGEVSHQFPGSYGVGWWVVVVVGGGGWQSVRLRNHRLTDQAAARKRFASGRHQTNKKEVQPDHYCRSESGSGFNSKLVSPTPLPTCGADTGASLPHITIGIGRGR